MIMFLRSPRPAGHTQGYDHDLLSCGCVAQDLGTRRDLIMICCILGASRMVRQSQDHDHDLLSCGCCVQGVGASKIMTMICWAAGALRMTSADAGSRSCLAELLVVLGRTWAHAGP